MSHKFVKMSFIKQKARELKALSGKSYCVCLEVVVRSYGFNSIAHYYSLFPKS